MRKMAPPPAERRAASIRHWLGGLMAFGLVFPLAASGGSRLVFAWTWDALKLLGQSQMDLPRVALVLLVLLPPLVGIGVLALDARTSRHARAVAYLGIGLFFTGLLLAMGSKSGLVDPGSLLNFVVGATVLVGTFVVLARPKHPTGHLVAGIAGLVALALLLLPITPSVKSGGETRTSGLLQIPELLEVPQIGLLLFLVAVGGLVATLLAVSLFSRDRGAVGRARLALWITGGVFALTFFAPFFLLGSMHQSNALVVLLVPLVSMLLLRLLPILGLVMYGATDLILQRILPDPVRDAEATVAVFGDARQSCLAIGREFELLKAGSMPPEEFRLRKLNHLKAAVRDARRSGRADALRGWVGQLRDLGAVSEAEAQGVARAVIGPSADAPPA